MKPEGSRNVLAPPTQAGRIGDFLLNLGWSLYGLVRSAARVLRRRRG